MTLLWLGQWVLFISIHPQVFLIVKASAQGFISSARLYSVKNLDTGHTVVKPTSLYEHTQTQLQYTVWHTHIGVNELHLNLNLCVNVLMTLLKGRQGFPMLLIGNLTFGLRSLQTLHKGRVPNNPHCFLFSIQTDECSFNVL